jgi:hypothetical protein
MTRRHYGKRMSKCDTVLNCSARVAAGRPSCATVFRSVLRKVKRANKAAERRSHCDPAVLEIQLSSFVYTEFNVRISSIALLCFLIAGRLAAVELGDESKLPPAASVQVDFDREIKPIFEAKCYQCHGAERPKSHFRLDDREAALKGGDNGVAIIPGNGAKSPLVHYIARLVPDMEMPPPGKGDPLTADEIGLVRAWIDQGASWGATNPPVTLAFSATPALRWISVSGDEGKFREIEGMKSGFGGGIEHFALEERKSSGETVSAEGRVLFPDEDFQIKLEVRKPDVGFVRGGFEQWRKYYDDTGGYYRPFSTPSFDLGRDLHLDIGRAWIDFGLTLPHWPRIIVGYEYQFRQGDKSMLTWGDVNGKRIYPSAKNINQDVHIAKLDITHDISGWRIEDSARVEVYSLRTVRADRQSFPDQIFVHDRQSATHVQGMNALRLEREINDNWLLTAGYLYSRLDGDASFNVSTLDGAGVPTIGEFWSSDLLLFKREAHVSSLATLFQPLDGLNISLGLQGEWQRQEGSGNIRVDQDDPTSPDAFLGDPATLNSDLDKSQIMESASVRYTKIPFTVLFGEVRFEQESIGQFEQEHVSAELPWEENTYAFLRETDATNHRRNGRLGFNVSPWAWFNLSAHYRNRVSETDYDHRLDLAADESTGILISNPGYSAFIRHRELDTDEAETKLVLRPVNWLRATLTYQWLASDYSTTTHPVTNSSAPEGLLAGSNDSHRYGLGVTVTPFQRLYISGAFTYTESRLSSATYGETAAAPYEGEIYTVLASANFALNKATDLHCVYSYSDADYGQNNFDGLPMGLTYQRHGILAGVSRRLTSNLVSTLRYGFYRYLEPSSGRINDYTAHGIFATVMVKWP